jgi:hypothetical protein
MQQLLNENNSTAEGASNTVTAINDASYFSRSKKINSNNDSNCLVNNNIINNNNNNNNHNNNQTGQQLRTGRQTNLYWEGPPAHFMLPTHAIHCRSSRSIERCPRACKGKRTHTLALASYTHTHTKQYHRHIVTLISLIVCL